MINRVKAIEDYTGLCFKCLQKKPNVKGYSINARGYGSWFDNSNTTLQICDDCKPEGLANWFYENPVMNEYDENYKYEQNIFDFIGTLPLEGQELFWCRCSSGATATYMDSQDWIDHHLGVMPEWKYTEYNMFSPYRMKISNERFQLCNEPINKIYSDGSTACVCPHGFGVHGEYNQKIGLNMWDTCYNCDQFHLRYEPIKEMTNKKYDKYAQIKAAKALLEREHELNEENE